jgi:hypothetical protein
MPSDKAQQGVAPIAAKIQRPTQTWGRAQKVGHNKRKSHKESLMTTIQEQIAVMQYFANGGKVETKSKSNEVTWRPITTPLWSWDKDDYRIAKPKKQKMWQWIIQQRDGCICMTAYFFKTKEDVLSTYTSYTVIKPALWTEIEV